MNHETRIGRLQFHTQNQSTSTARSNVARQLRQAQLQPAHLPSSAILVIQQLTHNGSFAERLNHGQARTRQLEQRIDDLARRAARPYKQGPSERAQSILFLDSVELLICFTQDLLAKKQTWYWQELFPELPLHAATFASQGTLIAAGWNTYPEAVPKTLAQLPQPAALQALRTLDRKQLQRTISVVHQHFGMTKNLPQNQLASSNRFATDGSTGNGVRVDAEPPWQAWVPLDLAKEVDPLAMYLLGVSHVLTKAPQVAQTPTFMARAAEWIEQMERGDKEENPEARQSSRQPFEHADRAHALDKKRPNQQPARNDSATNKPSEGGEGQYAEHSEEIPDDLSFSEPLTPEAPELDVVRTQLGGVFYLLNLVRWAWANEMPPEEELLNPWVIVATLMAGLLGERRRHYQADPLWDLLAELANQTAADSQVPRQALDHDLDAGVELNGWQEKVYGLIYEQLTQKLTTDGDALPDLFCLPAEVIVTNTHIDVTFPMNAVNIEIRRCGLDNSPGWQPLFGYIITFVFQ